jgi:predicted RNA-binding protein
MCETHAYVVRGGKEELLVRNAEMVESEGEELPIRDIYGQRYRVTAQIREIHMVKHRVVLVENFTAGMLSYIAWR